MGDNGFISLELALVVYLLCFFNFLFIVLGFIVIFMLTMAIMGLVTIILMVLIQEQVPKHLVG